MCIVIKIDIYNLNKEYKQWYLNNFDIVAFLGFNENDANLCIFIKMCIGKFMILIFYDNDVLLENIDMRFIVETLYIINIF